MDFIRKNTETILTPVEKRAAEKEIEKENTPVIQEEMENKKITSFVMLKNYNGSIAIDLEPWDFSSPARAIQFTFDQDYQHVPTKWALGVFVTPLAMKLMEEGYFTFENLSTLIKMAEDEGLYVPDSIKEPVIDLKELKKYLIKDNLAEVQKMMRNASRKLILDFVLIAKQNLNRLSMSMVQYIEKTYRVSLDTISLNE